MAIYSISDLRAAVPARMKNLSDEELVADYSKRIGEPYEQLATALGVKPRGFFSEMGRQLVGGLGVDVPRMVGQMQQTFARELPDITGFLEAGAQAQAAAQPAALVSPIGLTPTPSGAIAETGQRLRTEAEKAEPSYIPDMRGRGLAQQTFISGARAVGPIAATIPASMAPGGMPLAVGGLFGLSQAQETYEKLRAQGVSEEEATQASRLTGVIQGVGEAAATYVGGKLFKPLLGRAGGGTTAGVAAEMTDTGIVKPFAKGLATNLLVQPTTEIAQDVGTSLVEQAYGAKPEDLAEIAKQSAMGATGLTLLLGPFALGAHVSRSNNAAALKAALSDDPAVPREVRAQAIAAINVEAQRQGVDPRDIGRWTQEQIELEDRRTDALRRMTEAAQALEVGAGIEQRMGIGAPRLDEADYIQQFEEAFNEPSGQFTYETQPDGSQAPRELTMGEVLDRQANTDPSAPKDILASNEPKTAREVLAEIRQAANDPLSPSVWRFPVSTGLMDQRRSLFAAGPEAFNEPRPVMGGLSPAQQAALGGTPALQPGQVLAAQGPIDQTAPRPAMGLGSAQQFAAAGPQAQTSATTPVAQPAPSGGVSAALPPVAPAPEAFSTASTIASQWDRSNRSSRNQEWMAGAAESNPAFNAVEQEGANVPAHGMAKVATLGQAVKDLVSLLAGGIDSKRTFYYDPLTNPRRGTGAATGTAGGVAYRDGPFIITFREGLNGRQPTSADITGVLVNPANKELVAPLQQMFPNLVIRDYNKASDVVAASRTKTTTEPAKPTKPKKLTPEERLKEAESNVIRLEAKMVSSKDMSIYYNPASKEYQEIASAREEVRKAKAALESKQAKTVASQKTTIARSIEQALDEELELADRDSDTARVAAIMGEVNKEKLGAEVQGAKQIKAPGRVSLSQRSLLGIRDAIFRKSGKVAKAFGKKEQRVVDAVSNFTNAYDAYLNYSANIARDVKKGIQAKADERIAKMQDLAKDVQNALFELGQSVDNNAKNVEAIVRVVKDATQRKLATPGKTKAETLSAIKSLDTALSSGWAAAKRESFMKELPDMADVSGQQIRPSAEMQEKTKGKAVSAIESAAKNGYVNPQGKGEKYTGLAGALQYLRFNTTPMGRVLARALRDALVESDNPAKLVFTDKGGSRYDPKTNTVYINRGEQSAEVVLHETFHAALQWYVYQNPNAPAVKQLQLSLDRALAAKGLEGKALEVQVILRELVNNNRGLDAVLELVSYTATLNDFRRAMQEIKTGDAPKSFLESVRSVWAMYKAIVRRMLGVGDNVATDVLSASMELLEQSTKAQMPAKLEGKPLEAAVQSDKATQQAAGITAQDFRTYRKDIGPMSTATKMFFDVIGWEKGAKQFQKGASKVADMIRKDFPTLERFLIYINSRFSAGELTSQEIENFKVNKNVGYQQMERLANFVLNRPAEQIRALFDYMDGNKKALDNLPDKEIMTRTADNVMDWYKTYIKDLPAAERSFFETRKFSEALLYASKSAQVASSTFGARKLSEVIGLKHRGESTIEGFKDWIAKDENGDLELNGRFYQVFKNDGLRPGAGPEPAGFMSISEFEKRGRKSPDGFQVDATRQWWLSQYNVDKGYKFSSSMTARQALEENKVDELANAMRNTMAALANNYASRQFAKALAADDTIAFDSLEDIKKFSGQIVDEDQVLKVSQEEAKSPQIRGMYRRTGTWVKIPDSSAYGDLANKYIPGPVWSAMTDMSDRRPLVDLKVYNSGMRWFKKSKTVYNPGTHVTNIASNITLAMMHDIPMSTLGNAARIFALYEVRPSALTTKELDMMSAFMNSGAMLGNFSSAEVKQSLYDAWKENMNPANDNSLLKRLAAFTNYEKSKAQKVVQMATKLGKKADTYATELYAAEDNVFRLAAFLTKAGDLQVRDKTTMATPEQLRAAGDFARKAFLDYDIDSKAVRILRQSVVPFISWPYAVAPVLGRIALHQPWKIANIIMAYWLLEVGMAAMGDGDDEELRKAGPEYMRERMFFGSFGPRMFVRIPFMGDAENPVYYKLGDYVPFASMTKGLPNGLFGQSWIPSAITPSGPLVSAISGLLLGVDPYTGKDIHKPTDSEWDKLINSGKFAYDTVMPPAVSSANLSKVKDIAQEKQGITGKEPSNLVFARMLGLKLYDYNVEESLAIQDKVVKGVERDFKAAMRKAKQEEYRKGYPDYEALDAELDKLQERMDKRIAEIRGEEE